MKSMPPAGKGKPLQPLLSSDERAGIGEHEFPSSGIGIRDETKVRLNKICRPGSKFLYTYDFGDDWEHWISIEKIVAAKPGVKYPRCVAGRNACPPEDCSGPWGYSDLLEVLSDKHHENHEEILEWVGDDFDPRSFDLADANIMLASLSE